MLKMYGQRVYFVQYLVTLVLVRQVCSSDALDKSHNIYCNPYPQVVSVDQRGLPYFVNLHRCQGSIASQSPDIKKCVVKTYENVTVEVVADSGRKNIFLSNHTSCKEECSKSCPSFLTQNDECGCTCTHSSPPRGHECPEYHKWNSDKCECECDAPLHKRRRMQFDPVQCKFVCTYKCRQPFKQDPVTCRCYQDPAIGSVAGCSTMDHDQGMILVAVIFGEFIILFLIFDFILCRKKSGLLHHLCQCCKRHAGPPTQNREEFYKMTNTNVAQNGHQQTSNPQDV